jgi:hypothetical protein
MVALRRPPRSVAIETRDGYCYNMYGDGARRRPWSSVFKGSTRRRMCFARAKPPLRRADRQQKSGGLEVPRVNV